MTHTATLVKTILEESDRTQKLFRVANETTRRHHRPHRRQRRPTVNEPTVTCTLCGRHRVVLPDGRGFPPDIAKRKLRKECAAAGCPCNPRYLAARLILGDQ